MRPSTAPEEVGKWIDEEGGVAGGVVAVDDVGRVGGFVSPGRHETVFLADPALTDPLVDELLPWLREQRDVVQVLASGADTARDLFAATRAALLPVVVHVTLAPR